jgi:hypothetical protein
MLRLSLFSQATRFFSGIIYLCWQANVAWYFTPERTLIQPGTSEKSPPGVATERECALSCSLSPEILAGEYLADFTRNVFCVVPLQREPSKVLHCQPPAEPESFVPKSDGWFRRGPKSHFGRRERVCLALKLAAHTLRVFFFCAKYIWIRTRLNLVSGMCACQCQGGFRIFN